MPALPQVKMGGSSAPIPDVRGQNAEPSSSSSNAIQPAPSVVNTTSHAIAHVFPRRFLGPIPQAAAMSSKQEERRLAMRELRRSAFRRLLGEDELGIDDARGADARRRARRIVHHFRVRNQSSLGDETEMDYELQSSSGSSSSSEEEAKPAPKTAKKDKDGVGKGKGKDKLGAKAAKKKDKDKDKKKEKKKKKGKKKKGPADTWVGNSFDIGTEFETVPGRGVPPSQGGADDPLSQAAMLGRDVQNSPEMASGPVLDRGVHDSPDQLAGEAEPEGRPQPSTPIKAVPAKFAPSAFEDNSRASSMRSTGGETFVTARERGNASDSDESTFEANVPHPQPPAPPLSDGVPTSLASSPRAGASSQGDSRARLIHSSDEEADLGESRLSPRGSASLSGKARRSLTSASVADMGRGVKDTFNARLKSALRPSEAGKYDEVERPTRGKTVQFHHSPDAVISAPSAPSGAQDPAQPHEVLARSGSEVEGTSHDAVEDSTVIDEDVFPGGVVMRDRALVKIGRHRDEGIGNFDEAAQRRSPFYRVDPMEEYVLGMTVTSVDFYLDWVSNVV